MDAGVTEKKKKKKEIVGINSANDQQKSARTSLL